MSAVKTEPNPDTSMTNGRPSASNVSPPAGLNEIEKLVYVVAADYPAGVPVSEVAEKLSPRTPEETMEGINSLSKKGLLKFQLLENVPMVQIIELKDYAKTSSLDNDSKLIYDYIKEAKNEGIWTKDLKKRTNLHLNVVNRVLKFLEQKQLVKSVKHVKWPTRRFYMLYELTPSSEVTGGAWYTDQELDVDFIDTLAAACYKYIYSRSFPKDRNVIFKAGYDHYPSAAEVKRFIQEKRISSVELNLQDIICLLDLLIHDDLIEKKMPFETFMDDDEDMDDEKDDGIEWVYKAIHRNITSTTSDDRGIDPLSEVPCGKCPVFKFCTEDGPVSPSNCDYFQKWLSF
ncbi:34-kDa subunit of RNA polymerase III (C) [Umbelopsis nana]